ncbi:uncharacterized protein LOC117588845 [Drosophila guanche]|uniref:Uncharacterized protein n=1 Tax=Drosophila guanche TaxID=7266 RepID=A0A3B0KPB9_DROGU|nr:uncharacterized protein LOC117588845 [Drosophila guanche]SPP87001.1 Hypothetical predicted protein [Drosophila guanche]
MKVIRARDIVDEPSLVAPHPYINFLRFLKRKNPRYGLLRLLQEAPTLWDALTVAKQRLFKRDRILKRLTRRPIARRRRRRRQRRILRRNRGLPRNGHAQVRRPIYKRRPPARSRRRKKVRNGS